MSEVREQLNARLHELRERGDNERAEWLEQLIRDAHESERLSLTGDGTPRSTESEREREAA